MNFYKTTHNHLLLGLLGALFALGMLYTPTLSAEPYIAVREGYKCSQCHVNKTGGGKRNNFANIYVQTRLAADIMQTYPGSEKPAHEAVTNMYHGQLNEFLSVGADFRFATTYSEIPDLSGAGAGTAKDSTLTTQSGLVYFEMNMVPDRAKFYLDQNVTNVAATREIFLLIDQLPARGYLKLGKFFLPSGFRLQDDTAFVRSAPGFTYGNPQHGVEVGFEPGSFSTAIWATNDVDKYGLYGYWLNKYGRVGLSHNKDIISTTDYKTVSNIFGGFNVGRLTVLLEQDFITSEDVSVDPPVAVNSVAQLIEGNVMISKGHSLKISFEGYEPNDAAEGDIVTRQSVVYEPFLNQFLQLRVGYRKYSGQTNNGLENKTEAFAEVHTIFF